MNEQQATQHDESAKVEAPGMIEDWGVEYTGFGGVTLVNWGFSEDQLKVVIDKYGVYSPGEHQFRVTRIGKRLVSADVAWQSLGGFLPKL